MTSEELELSLKADFENYLNGTLDGIRQDVAEFQRNFEAEFAKHRSQMDEALQALSSRFESAPVLDRGFAESIVEHLRLARDEGAQLAASAFSEAEKLQKDAAPEARYDQLRNAINDISSRVTQVEILSSLIEQAGRFAPRGTFFILRNGEFSAWKSFGEQVSVEGSPLPDVKVPVGADTVLGDAVRSVATVESGYGSHADDEQFLMPLNLGRPDRMYAIPLMARGRAVAVLYADYGSAGINLNAEALETLVRVAGLTVELRAATKPVIASVESKGAPANQEIHYEEHLETEETVSSAFHEAQSEPEVVSAFVAAKVEPEPQIIGEVEPESAVETEFSGQVYEFHSEQAEEQEPQHFEEVVYEEAVVENEIEYSAEPVAAEPYVEEATYSTDDQEVQSEPKAVEVEYEPAEYTPAVEMVEAEPEPTGFAFSEAAPEEVTAATPEPEVAVAETIPYANGQKVETATVQPGRTRLSERNIDLPIEVSDDERKLHNNARRFARLLVSEIKLYNEQKVSEGREAGDLYPRLREAIDRSREMYDRRVEPTVAAKFDYFHYELLNDLAGGDVSKFGTGYPGAVA